MSPLLKHSAVGTLVRICRKGNISFSRKQADTLPDASSGDDVPPPFEDKSRDINLVDWDGPDDPDNPLNWPLSHKVLVTSLLCLYTFAVYVGSSIYTSSQQSVVEIFGVNHAEGALGLALYVLGYGFGCLLFSPVSELYFIGRNPPYAVSGLLFVLLCIPTALVNNYPGLMVLRFLLGFMCSPCLATAGASFGDIWRPPQFPFAIALWAGVAPFGPACGPTMSSFAVQRLGWRFSAWELLIIAGPIYLLLICCLPETSGSTILHYRTKRLRELTGNMDLISEAERKQKDVKIGSLVWDALFKPWEMNIKDPALLFTTIYMGLAYGIYYSFFESLPLVYPVFYNFSPSSTGLIFLASIPACVLSFIIQCWYLKKRALPKHDSGTFGELENYLIPGLIASPALSISLFIYGWTSRPSIPWIVPTLGVAILSSGMYFISQSIFNYIPMIYPHYAASIFAANSLARSLFAVGAILVARPMFEALGIGGGASLLGGLMALCVLGMGVLFRYGKALRARSRFAVG
ncbi:MFS general substrate transporter [Melanomma pulvis-pyrius CBS 109.77]|uniref:MFS general substrate transporter n=1 Tax=Melanomma pulvis-pyrius CBS 109.77 TaxID=1314802 RepID=A0A6A6X4Q5_9PLEO|nr:MFS general substrate transporter [Melanomma pulvis-pyrius CBS 109.77]